MWSTSERGSMTLAKLPPRGHPSQKQNGSLEISIPEAPLCSRSFDSRDPAYDLSWCRAGGLSRGG